MKILIVSQYYYPENFIINDLAKSLKKSGSYVEVLTALPNYPSGYFFKGYSFFSKKTEWIDEIKINRSRIFPRLSGKKLFLALNYLSFILFASLRLTFMGGNFDKVFIYAPSPITVGIVGILSARKYKAKSYLWVQDLWPESVKDAGNVQSKTLLGLLNTLTKLIYKYSNYILIQSESFRDYIIDQGIENEKIKYLPNYAEDIYENFPQESDKNKNIDKTFSITYAGNIGEAQNLEILIQSAIILKSKEVKVKFVIIGTGRKKQSLNSQVIRNNLQDYFEFLGRKKPSEMPKYLSSSSVLLISLKKSKIFSLTIPSKLQAYMASSKPILGSIDGITNDIIKKSNSGYVSDSEDVEGLVKNIIKFISLDMRQLKNLSNNSRNYYDNNFSKNIITKRILELLSL